MLHGDYFVTATGDPNIRVDMFKKVHELSPNTLLFVNDYSVLLWEVNRLVKDWINHCVWSKTTLIKYSAVVEPPYWKTGRFIEISNQMELNDEVRNFGYYNESHFYCSSQIFRLRHLAPFDWKFLQIGTLRPVASGYCLIKGNFVRKFL